MVKHFAFTLIELIFAIVIIGITMLSLPMMNQVISTNTEESIVQEAIFATSAELTQAITYKWDENSIDPGTYLSRVTSTIDCDSLTKRRPGHINQVYHRRCTDSNGSSGIGLDTGETEDTRDDLDDIHNSNHDLFVGSDGDRSTGYKKRYTSNYKVTYASFGGTTASEKNIKRIEVTVSDKSTAEEILKLYTFSANIGEVDYYKRSY